MLSLAHASVAVGAVAAAGIAAVVASRARPSTTGGAAVPWDDLELVPLGFGYTLADLTRTGRNIDPPAELGGEIAAALALTWSRVGAPAVALGAGITSGYRWPELNTLIGGSPTSYHLTGHALDLSPPPGRDAAWLLEELQKAGVQWRDAIVYAPRDGGHLHVDVPRAGAPFTNRIKAHNTAIASSYPVQPSPAAARAYVERTA